MNTLTKQAIHNANMRGMQFHVVCDQKVFLKGEWVGKAMYSTSWNSYELAKAIASREINGVVYNSALQQV